MIRKMTLDDFPAVFSMARAFHAESIYSDYEWSDEKVVKFFEAATTFVAFDDSGVFGFLAAFLSEVPFGTEKYAYEFGVYIKPKRRGGGGGTGLIRAFESWAKENGAKLVSLGISSGISQKRTSQLYERLGYAPLEIIHRKYLE